MADIDDAYAETQRLAAELAVARRDLAVARDHAARLRARRAAVLRRTDPRDPAAAQRLAALDAELAGADAAAAEAAERVRDLTAKHLDAARRYGELADPVTGAGRLSGEVPALLLPVRLETRFIDDDLCVRIYPDQWAVDTFDPRLSEVELDSARRFWVAWWEAGGDDDRRRAAWRGLVASHGSGRGGWITRRHRPVVPADEPVRGSADEVMLVVVGAYPRPERPAVRDYWTAVRGGDPDQARKALDKAVGEARAAEIVAQPPPNLDAPGDGLVRVAFLELPAPSTADTRLGSWTAQARARVLPDMFVLLGFRAGKEVLRVPGNPVPPDLAVGPDPGAEAAGQFRVEKGELVVPEELRWMVDFPRAVDVGMGFRVRLAGDDRGGFDRLFVLGLRVGATPEESRDELGVLLEHHLHSRTGFALVPQGTPTNNTERAGAGYDRFDDPEASYDRWVGTGTGLHDDADWARKQDGQWLAEVLGFEPKVFARVPGADGTDLADARAADTALWPATWGYFLDSMLHPGISGATVDATRAFFLRYVSGRGLLPAVRIGRQPYGVLPTTVHSRLSPVDDGLGDPRPVRDLWALVDRVARDWQPLADAAPHVGATDGRDPQQVLLDVLGQHPASVEFHQRYAESVADLFNRARFDGLGGPMWRTWRALVTLDQARRLLVDLGWRGTDPDALGKLFHSGQQRLRGPLVDDRPASETERVRAYTDTGANYLEWLADAGSSSLDTVRRQLGFSGNRRPTALLYLLLRHAVLLSWWDTSLRLRRDAGVLTDKGLHDARQEPAFIHVATGGSSESRWQSLYSPERAVTGDPARLVVDAIPALMNRPATRHLRDVTEAIRRLSGLPTARLERVLAEHLDLCSYRLDAWRLGFTHQRLLALRGVRDGAPTAASTGLHLGAYGWLEDVRPEPGDRERFHPPAPLDKTFDDPADAPLMRDPTNGGFVHAPSLDHAATAAVLRSGYLAHADATRPTTMAVNLSSHRMRLARSLIEGVRNGQPLGALLGYRFERGLHDRHGMAEVDRFIRPLRLAFPAPGDRDGRLAVDGLALVRRAAVPAQRKYPFGLTGLEPAGTAEAAAIDLEVDALLDVHDAVADLALAEGVHQAVLGNVDRAGATLDAYGKGGFPPDPAVLETPRSGRTLTHRLGLHLRAGLDHLASPVPGLAVTPRALAEPAANDLLARLLPAPADTVVRVSWTDRAGTGHERLVTQHEVGLQPIDLLALLHLDGQALTELDERIVRLVETDEGLPPDVAAGITVHYTDAVPGRVTLFEAGGAVAHLRTVLHASRPLRPTDLMAPNDARRATDADAARAYRDRPAAVLDALDGVRAGMTVLASEIDGTLATPHQVLLTVDTLYDGAVDALTAAAGFGLPGCGRGDLAARRLELFTRLLAIVDGVVDRWQRRLTDADRHLAAEAALPTTATGEERIRRLLLAERALTTTPTTPVPTAAVAYRATVDGVRAGFHGVLTALRAVRPAATGLGAALAAVAALPPLTPYDPAPLDTTAVDEQVLAFAGYLRDHLRAAALDAAGRAVAAADHLTAHDVAAPGQPRVDLIVAATRALLGESALVVPEFAPPAGLADEWTAALAWSRTGQLTAHLAADRPFPVDDWLLGAARVREKARAWEQAALLTNALGAPEPVLQPVQFPHAAEPWLALELPDGVTVPGDRILYTAHYPAAFDPAANQCGLLLDEWVETVPGDVETTGLTFHHDAPDCEAPQAMLLVVPPDDTKRWRWQDLVDTLTETLELARLRAVEPAQVDDTAYAAFLPATVTAATVHGIALGTDFAHNNGLRRALGGDDD